MIERYPKYYEEFACIAGECEDTCCAGWEIDIDDASYERYAKLPGEFGELVRQRIKSYDNEDDQYESHGFCLTEDRRCPFLNENNLCDMILELGEDSICDVCTYTPRNFLEYGGVREISISPSCAEAGRLIFGQKDKVEFCERQVEGELSIQEDEEDIQWAKQVMTMRDGALYILQNREKPIRERVAQVLCYGQKIQDYLNVEEYQRAEALAREVMQGEERFYQSYAKEKQLQTQLSAYEAFCMRIRTFSEMDSVGEEWEKVLQGLQKAFLGEDGEEIYLQQRHEFQGFIESNGLELEYEQMLVYEAFLFLGRCVDDDNFLEKLQYVLASYLMMLDMDIWRYMENGHSYTIKDRVELAKIYAKEIEHSQENLDILEEAFLFDACFKMGNLLAEFKEDW